MAKKTKKKKVTKKINKKKVTKKTTTKKRNTKKKNKRTAPEDRTKLLSLLELGEMSYQDIEDIKSVSRSVNTDGLVMKAIELINGRMPRYQIIIELQEEAASPLTPKTLNLIIAEARALMRFATSKSKEDFKAEAITYYESIVGNSLEDTAQRTQAQKALDEIIGTGAKWDNGSTDEDEVAHKLRTFLSAVSGTLRGEVVEE